jgi:serine/threonine protein kinase/tetratricopeptide (TPR) repeat protein
MTAVTLGAFELKAPLGAGAMAQVWHGAHLASGLPVAIKVMTATHALAPTYARAFRNEVEAVARLSHSGIVRVFDFGQVSPEAAGRSAGAVESGAPYLVMELASHGSLDEAGVPGNWSALKQLLRALLDALAHAHARGVIHRDLKPANVLVDRGPRTISYKLTDFGIAHAMRDDGGEHGSAGMVSGTPPFMAPEQFSSEWRDQGPWTDLYALGCTAYALASGDPPFSGDDLPTMALNHNVRPPPVLVTRFDVPQGFEDWVNVLLAKRASERFECAADARLALDELEDPSTGDVSAAPLPSTPFSPTAPLEATFDSSSDRGWISTSSPTRIWHQPPPLPASWRTRDEPHAPPLTGAGIGIFGLRSIPMVDRDVERDALWARLRQVHGERRAQAVLLRGSAGSGKSRIARWIAERAAEVGGARVMRASHSSEQGTHDGVTVMLARYLRCDGLGRDDTRLRARAALADLGDDDGYLLDAVTDLLAAPDSQPAHLLENAAAQAEAKSRVLLRCLHLIALARPLVLVLDDVHWGLDALRLVHVLLRERPPQTPILALLTLRDEALAQRPLEQQVLAELRGKSGFSEIVVSELAAADQRGLIEQLLGLSGGLVDKIALRTGGNPLFAVQLVGDWIARGLLVATEHGLSLAPGSGDELPDDIHALCRHRIELALAPRGPQDRDALELAALLGGEVHEREWERACQFAQLAPSSVLLSELARVGLLERGWSSWRFAHGVLRETLERMAHERGRWTSHHRVIAAVLRERYAAAATSELCMRIGRHLLQAGDLEEAQRWLFDAARMLRLESDHERALALLAERDAVLDRLQVPPVDQRRAKAMLLRALIDFDCDQLETSERCARAVLEQAHAEDWPLIEAHASLRLGGVLLRREEYEEALDRFELALATLSEAGDHQGEFEARTGIAEVCYYQASLHAADSAYRVNLALAEKLGDAVAMAESHYGLGYVALWQSRIEDGERHFLVMRELLTKRSAWYRLMHCMSSLGEAARLGGRYEAAEQYYREALRLSRTSGRWYQLTVRINMALVRLFRGEYDVVGDKLPILLKEARDRGRTSATALLLAIQLALDAKARRWDTFDDLLARIDRMQRERGMRDGDIALVMRLAADASREAGEMARALEAYRVTRAQWQLLGRTDQVVAIEEIVGTVRRSRM